MFRQSSEQWCIYSIWWYYFVFQESNEKEKEESYNISVNICSGGKSNDKKLEDKAGYSYWGNNNIINTDVDVEESTVSTVSMRSRPSQLLWVQADEINNPDSNDVSLELTLASKSHTS